MKVPFPPSCALLLALALSAAAPASAQSGATGPSRHRALTEAPRFREDAERWVTDALARLSVIPGITLTVVVEDKVVLARGFGSIDGERRVPSDADTLYYIASSTKSFTALAAALLDARGTLDLDSTLASHVEGVTVDAALRPGEIKLRDLLTHTSGLDNAPIAARLAYTGEHDPATLWRLIARSTAAEGAPLGTFSYTNSGYNILGLILDRELGKPWQDLLRDEIFRPAGMARTTAYASQPGKQRWTVAPPCFGLGPEGIVRMPLEKQDNTMQSAGGLMSTASDLGRWLVLQIGDGRIDGRQVFDAAAVRATHALLVETSDTRPPFGRRGYGLGWFHGDLHGRAVLHHGGGFPGYRASISFMPEARVGVAVMVNEDSAGGILMDALAVWAYEWWLDVAADERRAAAQLDELVAQLPVHAQRFAAHQAELAARTWQLARPRADYAGTYVSDLWGTVVITLRGEELEARAGNLVCVATPYTSPETMRVELIPHRGQVVVFEPATGPVERIVIDGDAYTRVR